jgi:tRNA-dihydrouridine synthase A
LNKGKIYNSNRDIFNFMINRRLCIAPMIDWTDRFQRYFMRLITPHALLYTEMIHANGILKGNRDKLLAFDPSEHPVALQLGGSDPNALAEASKIGADFGYDEINLNLGCPSDRVQAGRFGACMMAEPALVVECLNAMQAAVTIPVTIKCRIGIDKEDSYDFFRSFVERLHAHTACRVFIVHARSAWLKGLSPKENREIPPLHYDYAYQIKKELPDLQIILNGGIKTPEAIQMHLTHLDGVMIGREAYHNPYFLSAVDQDLYQDTIFSLSREEVLERYVVFIKKELGEGSSLAPMLQPLLGLYHGQPQGRLWRRMISDNKTNPEVCHLLLNKIQETKQGQK